MTQHKAQNPSGPIGKHASQRNSGNSSIFGDGFVSVVDMTKALGNIDLVKPSSVAPKGARLFFTQNGSPRRGNPDDSALLNSSGIGGTFDNSNATRTQPQRWASRSVAV